MHVRAPSAAPTGDTFLFTGATTTVAMPLMRKMTYDADALIGVIRIANIKLD